MYLRILTKVGKFLPSKVIVKAKPFFRKVLPDVPYIIFLPTLRCNYKCAYCNINTKAKYFQKYSKENEYNWKEWEVEFNKFPPSMISISGGSRLSNLI